MEINRIIGVNCKNLNNVTFGCFGKRNNPTNDSVDFKTKNNVKKDNQSPQNFLDAIKGLFSQKSSANLDEDRKKEIENLQEKTKDIDAEKVRQYFDGERTVRTTTVKMNSSSKKIGNAEKVAKTTTATKNDYSHLPNQPKFSFDYDKLVEDLTEIDEQVDEKWVTENPDSALNLINAAAKGEPFSEKQWNIVIPLEQKILAINTLISNKDKFIEEATKQYKMAIS